MTKSSATAGSAAAQEAGAATAGPSGDVAPMDSTPDEGAQTETRVLVRGTASDDAGVASVFVQIGPNAPRAAQTSDGFRTWSYEGDAPPGTYRVQVYAFDRAGRRSETVERLLHAPSSSAGAASPTIEILTPDDGLELPASGVVITGRANDDETVVRVEVERNGERLEERPILTDDFFAGWARTVTLLAGQANVFTFRAYDALGNVGTASITLFGAPEVDRAPPQLAILAPADGATLDAASLELRGSASDRLGVREVKVQLGRDLTGDGVPEFGESVFATTTDAFATFALTLDIPSGPFWLKVKAIDISGVSTTEVLTLENDHIAEWSEERRLPLFLRPTPDTTVRLELDRAGVDEVIVPSVQAETEILRLNPDALVRNALTQIKNACGTAWRNDAQNPNHDCSLTELGRTFSGGDGTWQSSAEYSMVRILTMTPANVAVAGTSLEGLEGLAGLLSAFGLAGDFSDILAETLGIPRTTEIVGTDAVADAIRDGVIAPHPNTGANGELIISLFDAMNDLAPLGARLGPVGEHPGILAAGSSPFSQVFTDEFEMIIVASSNLRWRDGVVLSEGKDYIAVVEDATGPSFDDVLEFDFNDPARFDVLGLSPDPVVDLRFVIQENPGFVPACTGNGSCQGNYPASPVGTQHAWSLPTWDAERIVTTAALDQYRNRVARPCAFSFIACLARINVGQGGAPPGWTEFNITLNLGSPPQPQFIWEMVSEVAQVALHELPAASIAEGDANVAFTLEDIGVGLTADEIRAAVRPVLQGQASRLSDMLLGDFAANNGRVDFFYARDTDGTPTLFFAAPSDPRPGAPYAYAQPGFFADVERTSRLSQTTLPGSSDTEHEKLRLAVGETVTYLEDEAGDVYRVRFVVGDDATEINAFVARRNR